ncbi:hypothetical protein ABCY62_11115 [Acetivibrio clariflavus]|uniref:AbiJ-NTD4 domain-containing protein n=1 Tax=Acetivibrio clariflavus TaxID=288965 RepID=UPI0031F4AD0A
MLFSQRYGYKPIKEIIQVDNMDNDLRNGLWNALCLYYWRLSEEPKNKDLDLLIKIIWMNYFKLPVDKLPIDWYQKYELIRNYFFRCEWYEVYDFIEFVSANYNSSIYNRSSIKTEFRKFCNRILEQENSGYRFVDEYITKIISEQEIETIEKALKRDDKYLSIKIHLETALKLLTDKKKPDYRNSIKESISAVEAVCKIITDDSKATLGKALNLVDQKYGLHSALKGAFEKLYGYSSDADGIRHALLDVPKLCYEDALYFFIMTPIVKTNF